MRLGVGTRIAVVCHIAALVLVAACAGGEEPSDETRYPLTGSVVATSRELGTVTVDHDPVADYMGRMTMPFNVRDDWVFDAAAPGAQLSATLVVAGEASWLEDVVVRTPAADGAAAQAVIAAPDPGAPVPPTDLLDQSGSALNTASYAGEYFAYTFIYTRCPIPDFRPRMSEHFDAVYEAVEADPARYGDLKLLSLSIDTEFDTPEVLTDYGMRYLGDSGGSGFERWRFATSDPYQLADLAEFTGLRFRPDRSDFVHSLRTVLVGPDQRVIEAFVGNAWQPDALLTALADAVARSGG